MYMGFTHPAVAELRKDAPGEDRFGEKKLAEELEAEIMKQLDEKQQKDYLAMCRKLKIDKYDLEMFRIMSLFQYQKRCLEDIPAEIGKHRKELKEHNAEISKLSGRANESANAIEKHLEAIKAFNAQSEDPIAKVSETATEVVEKTAENLHGVMRSNLKVMEEEVVEAMNGVRDDVYSHLDNIFTNVKETFETDLQNSLKLNMEEINRIIAEAAGARVKTAAKIMEDTQTLKSELEALRTARKEYLAEIRSIKWANWRWCSASMMVILLCSWVFFHLHYRSRLNDEREIVARQMGENHAVLLALSQSNRRLEFVTRDNGKKVLLIRNAAGWTTMEKHGAIEFK